MAGYEMFPRYGIRAPFMDEENKDTWIWVTERGRVLLFRSMEEAKPFAAGLTQYEITCFEDWMVESISKRIAQMRSVNGEQTSWKDHSRSTQEVLIALREMGFLHESEHKE